jgi:hypothetical protein
MGWRRFLSARLWTCSGRSPRSGGAASKGPITLRRNRPHCWSGPASPKTCGHRVFHFLVAVFGDVRLGLSPWYWVPGTSLVHRLLNPLGFVRRSPDQLAFFKAVRAGLAVKRRYLNHNGRVRQPPDGKTANRPRPEGCLENESAASLLVSHASI